MKGKKFKEYVFFLTAILLAMWTILPMARTPEAIAAPEKVQLKMGGSNTGSFMYMFSAVMVDLWKRNIPDLDITLMATAGSGANHLPLDRGEFEIATSNTPGDWWAMKGMYLTTTKLSNFCSLFPVSTAFHHALTYADAPIKGWKDMDGKRVNLGARASSGSIAMEEHFKALNIQPKFIFSLPTEAADMIKDRRIDAFAYGVGAPYSVFIDIARALPVKLILMTPEEQEKVVKAVPFLFPLTIPAKTYSFQNEDCPTVGAYANIIVRSTLSEELVYKLTKVAWENWNEVVKVVPAAKGVSPKDIINMVAPIHSGGVKYYREIGINIPDRLIWKKS
jgi:TRAP transporter TAXI family solute receptor